MPAATFNLTTLRKIEQGSTYHMRLYLSSAGIDFTGCTVSSKIRAKTSDTASVATFTCVTDMDAGYPSTPGSKFWVDLTLTGLQTSAIPMPVSSTYRKRNQFFVYDVEVTLAQSPHTGEIIRVIEGDVEVSPEATKNG